MQQRLAKRARGSLSRGALISLLLHFNLVAPLVIAAWVYGGREEAQKAEEVDVAFQAADQTALPDDLPPIEPTPETPEPLDQTAQKEKDKPKKPAVKPPEQAKKELEKKPPEPPKPEPEVVVPPPPAPPQPPPPPPERKAHEKMVDLDNDKDVPPPPDAKFLAQKNNKVAVETRAEDTNLQKNQQGQQAASAKSERQDDHPGAQDQKIAQLDEQKSLLGRSAPEVTPHQNPEVSQPRDEREQTRKSLLALRDPAPKHHELTPETADLSLPHAADGEMPLPSRATRGDKSDPSHLPEGNKMKLALSAKDYEYMFGAAAEAERRLAQQTRSTRQGKFQQKLARVRAAVENFIPEVKPGNQTALNTRAAPFAAYIARMHRSIHELWGFGQLEEWDDKPGSSPFNNRNLVTELEIVLNGDGTVDRVGVARSSGLLEYDVAAVDVAYTAGPYPDPPRAIRSSNGKIYLHWRFYRDERQCATSGAEPYILANASAAGDKPTLLDPPRPPAVAPAAGGAASGGGERRLQHLDGDDAHRGKRAALEREVAAAESAGSPEPPAAPRGAAAAENAAPPSAGDAGANDAASRWFAALAGGDVGRLLDQAALPFKTNGRTVTRRADLQQMLVDLMSEGVRRPGSVRLVTAAALRAAIGKLPPDLEDAGGQLYAAVSMGQKDMLILVLGQRAGGWRPVGMVRR
ncbi:MAG TPA: TonB C-terminal domain-containing protein [Polyangia bacterium]|nr:TonB C-terminal domain-containing protein [Polyangia bacterium]